MEEIKPLRAGLLIIWAALTLFVTTLLGFLVGFLFDYHDFWSLKNYLLTTGALISFVLITVIQTAILYSVEKYIDSLD